MGCSFEGNYSFYLEIPEKMVRIKYKDQDALQPKGWDVENIAVPGANSYHGLEHCTTDLPILKPDVVLVSLSLANEGLKSDYLIISF